MDKKFCTSCGRELEEGVTFCTNCGTKASQDNNVVSENNNTQTAVVNEQPVNNQVGVQQITNTIFNNGQNDNKTKPSLLGILSIVLIYGIPYIGVQLEEILPTSVENVVMYILPFSPLAGIVLMIIGRVNNPNDKFLKLVMWIVIISIIFTIIGYIVFFLLCSLACGVAGGGERFY